MNRRIVISTASSFLLTLLLAGSLTLPARAQTSDFSGVKSGSSSTAPSPTNFNPDDFTPEIPLPKLFEGPQKMDSNLLANYIRAIYVYFVWVVGIVAVVMVMYGGIKWVAAAGNPGQIKDARDIIDSAIIGVIIALTSVVLLNIINPKLTKLQLPGLKEVEEKLACFNKIYPDVKICKGSVEIPCGITQEVSGKSRTTGEPINYTCYGTYCKTQNNISSICMFVASSPSGYGTPTCVTSIPVVNTDDKCTVTGMSTIPVTSKLDTSIIGTFTGDILVGRGGLGTEYIGNYCRSQAQVFWPVGFIVGAPKPQVLLPIPDAYPASPTSYSRLNGRGCADWDNDLQMSELLLP